MVKVTFQTDETDYQQFDLFYASKSPVLLQSRRKIWLRTMILFAIFSGVFFVLKERFFGFFFAVFFLVILFFYPAYISWRFKERIKRSVKKKYGHNFVNELIVTFNDDNIEVSGSNAISTLNFPEAEQVDETGEYFFIRFKSGSLFIPKTKIVNIDEVRNALKGMTTKINIGYITELDWKWK